MNLCKNTIFKEIKSTFLLFFGTTCIIFLYFCHKSLISYGSSKIGCFDNFDWIRYRYYRMKSGIFNIWCKMIECNFDNEHSNIFYIDNILMNFHAMTEIIKPIKFNINIMLLHWALFIKLRIGNLNVAHVHTIHCLGMRSIYPVCHFTYQLLCYLL